MLLQFPESLIVYGCIDWRDHSHIWAVNQDMIAKSYRGRAKRHQHRTNDAEIATDRPKFWATKSTVFCTVCWQRAGFPSGFPNLCLSSSGSRFCCQFWGNGFWNRKNVRSKFRAPALVVKSCFALPQTGTYLHFSYVNFKSPHDGQSVLLLSHNSAFGGFCIAAPAQLLYSLF